MSRSMPRTRCDISKMPASTPLIITARPWSRYNCASARRPSMRCGSPVSGHAWARTSSTATSGRSSGDVTTEK